MRTMQPARAPNLPKAYFSFSPPTAFLIANNPKFQLHFLHTIIAPSIFILALQLQLLLSPHFYVTPPYSALPLNPSQWLQSLSQRPDASERAKRRRWPEGRLSACRGRISAAVCGLREYEMEYKSNLSKMKRQHCANGSFKKLKKSFFGYN